MNETETPPSNWEIASKAQMAWLRALAGSDADKAIQAGIDVTFAYDAAHKAGIPVDELNRIERDTQELVEEILHSIP